MGRFIKFFILNIIGILIWIFDILIPFGEKILINIQNHANLNTPLDLIYCFKQVLIIFGYTFLLFIWWLVGILLIFKKK